TSTYHDTADGRLARVGITLRRRVEDGKSTWQLKLPRSGYRLEVGLPGGPAAPPEQLTRALVAVLRGADLVPVATMRTRRGGVRVAENGTGVAEVVLDDVAVLDGQRVVGGFRELEIELVGPGDGETMARLDRALRHAGAEPADQRSKLARTLGLESRRTIARD